MHRRARGIAVLLLLLVHGLLSAQDVSPSRVKAAFLSNFARCTEWPAGAMRNGDPFTICVVGDAAVAEALQGLVKNKLLANRRVVVWAGKAGEPNVPACQMLYFSGLSAKQLDQILSGLRNAPVLSVSDIDGAAEQGVIVQFVYQGGSLGFKIQLESAKRAGVQISSSVLKLSK